MYINHTQNQVLQCTGTGGWHQHLGYSSRKLAVWQQIVEKTRWLLAFPTTYYFMWNKYFHLTNLCLYFMDRIDWEGDAVACCLYTYKMPVPELCKQRTCTKGTQVILQGEGLLHSGWFYISLSGEWNNVPILSRSNEVQKPNILYYVPHAKNKCICTFLIHQ